MLSLSKYFQEFKEGDRVAVIREHSLHPAFPKRIQGLTGTIMGMRGHAYLVKLFTGSLEKMFIIRPVHLKKLN